MKKKALWITMVLTLVICLAITNCLPSSYSSSKQIDEKMGFDKEVIKRIDDSILGKKIRYYSRVNTEKKATVIFIHGAPGEAMDFIKYLKDESLYSKASLITIDRLGYGNSERGAAEPSIQIQSSIIQTIIKRNKLQHVILVGWSYGGPIVANIAALYPEKIDAVIMLAPAIDPNNEKFKTLASISLIPPLKWLIPKDINTASKEKGAHVNELEKLKPLLSQIKTPIIHFHGNSDMIVPYANINYSIQQIDSIYLEPITLDKTNHFIPFSNYNEVKNKILEFIKD